MRKTVLWFGFICVASTILGQATIADGPLSERIANYDISVTLDHENRMILGKQTLTWTNPSTDTIRTLQLHLYLNAFKNSKSTFLSRSPREIPEALKAIDIENWGWSQITKFADQQGTDITEQLQYIQPNDDNEHDQTVVEVTLDQPVYPNETQQFQIEFKAKIPKIVARTGYGRDYYFMVQWFPKLGVYEPAGMRYAEKGQWNCHQYHSRSEYYANFGVYDVSITVPENMIVGASGVFVSGNINDDGTKTHVYRAEDVIDFAWTASPHFHVVKDKWKHVDIKLMIQPEHKEHTIRYIKAAKQAMEYFAAYIGEYPYTTLTIVDPPIYGIRSSGMEYPTLVTGASIAGLPNAIRTVEIITVHEFAHQYFMQMLASNEYEEPWLDEGFTTYFENRIMDHYYGDQTASIDLLGYKVGGMEQSRTTYTGMSNPQIAEVFRPASGFKHGGYNSMAYHKTATWLVTLENIVGRKVMDNILKTYFERWRFKHPSGQDFIDIVNEIVPKRYGDKFGVNMDWFFEQVLYSNEICDYMIHEVNNKLIPNEIGYFDSGGDKEFIKTNEDIQDSLYVSKVVIYRLGQAKYPVDILVRFDDGSEVLEHWDGLEPTYESSYSGSKKIEWAHLDPESKNLMDLNLNNNSKRAERETTVVWKFTSKFMFWVENLITTLTVLI